MKKAAIFFILFLIFAGIVWGQDIEFTWTGAGDAVDWEDCLNWSPDDPNYSGNYPGDSNSIGRDDIVIININSSIQYSGLLPLTIKELNIQNGDVNIDLTNKLTIGDFTVGSVSIVTIEAGDDIEVTGTLTNDGTLNFKGAKLSAGTLTNDGTLNLGSSNLTVNTLTNGYLIKLQGNQAVSVGGSLPPAVSVGGTIQYQGGTQLTPSFWSFGSLYENLIIDSSSNMGAAGDLDINGAATFYSKISAASLTVRGSSTIHQNITTAGNQTYASVTLASSIILTSGGGSITANGKVTGTNVTFNALHGISLTNTANALDGNITLDNTQSGTASGNITFTNASALTGLTAKNNTANGKITIDQTGNLPIDLLHTAGASGSISIEASGNVTQTGAITTSSLTVDAGTSITLDKDNNVENVTLKSNTSTAANGNVTYSSGVGEANALKLTVDTIGNITITEKTGGLEVEQITSGVDIELKAHADIKTKGITVSGTVKLEAHEDITVTDVNAYQLIAITKGDVTVEKVYINVLNVGFEEEEAAIYIKAHDFIVTPTGSIVPGGPGGQLCLVLSKKWLYHVVVDDDHEDEEKPFGDPDARWHQHFVEISGKHLVYGNGSVPSGFAASPYVKVLDTEIETNFELSEGFSVYISNARITPQNADGLKFKTSGIGTIQFSGTNNFESLDLVTESDITLENIGTLGDITVETKIDKEIIINQSITTAETQEYKGKVTLGGSNALITLNGTIVTFKETITGNGKSLTIDGNGILNGGNSINDLFVSGTAVIDADITTTTGTQIYTGEVTLGGTGARTLKGTTVTLGTITGNGESLTIDGNGVLNGGSGINDLSVSGTVTINADITTAGDQTYTGAATLGGSGERKITSNKGSIVFGNTLNSVNEIKLLAASGNITITGKTTAKQLIAKASASTGIVTVDAITIDSSAIGNDGESAAIYIEADNFIVTATQAGSIVPGGAGGQLCLHLNKKWKPKDVIIGAEDDFEHVGSVPNARWHQHFVVVGKILYSFTEDSNGNGRLDRIRVQANKDLAGNFTNFKVSVVGYEVDKTKGIMGFDFVNTPSDKDSFYIYLEEKSEFDGGNCPDWKIEEGSISLVYKGIVPVPVANSTEGVNHTIDTIPPRIAYTLTLPGRSETYVQMSEPLASFSDTSVSFGSGSVTVSAASPANLWYLFSHSASYGADALAQLHNIYNDAASTAGNGYFQMSGIEDNAQEPTDDPDYEPKYPLNWGYTGYAKSDDINVLKPPNKLLTVDMMKDLADNNGSLVTLDKNGTVTRRVTDVLVSLSPNNYFALPVWAKPSDDNNSIMEFDGSKYLEKDSIEKSGIDMQARISNNLTIVPQLFWTTADIPADMRNPKDTGDGKKTGGLWLPNALTNPLYYYVPLLKEFNQTPPAANSTSPLFNYDIAADDLAKSGARFEFIFRSSSVSDMFIARLDAPPGVIPNNWYTLIRPFSFNIQGIRYQRGGVTILNNVINSDNKETAYIRYDLPRAGRVTIQIYTLDGTLVKSIRRNENREAGAYVDTWDGSNNGGRAVARGMYFVRVVGPDIDEIRKIMVVK